MKQSFISLEWVLPTIKPGLTMNMALSNATAIILYEYIDNQKAEMKIGKSKTKKVKMKAKKT